MKKISLMSIGKISLQNGCRAEDQNRTIMSVTGLSAITPVEFIETRSRMRGTGYNDSIYRIYEGRRPTDDALIVQHNAGSVDNLFWDEVKISRGFFKERREYGRKCYFESILHGLPMDACLSVGPENCAELAAELFYARIAYLEDEGWYSHELFECGISRRKNALENLFSGCSDELIDAIRKSGQKRSRRLADLFSASCDGMADVSRWYVTNGKLSNAYD